MFLYMFANQKRETIDDNIDFPYDKEKKYLRRDLSYYLAVEVLEANSSN